MTNEPPDDSSATRSSGQETRVVAQPNESARGDTPSARVREKQSVLRERINQQIQPLDYSPRSGSVGSTKKDYYTQPQQRHGTSHQTSLDTSGVTGETKWRFGSPHDKWEWLKRLNRGNDTNNRSSENRARARQNDIELLVDIVAPPTPYDEWLTQRTLTLADRLAAAPSDDDDDDETTTTSDSGFRFGPQYPVESVEIALLTIAARTLVDVETYDELSADCELHNLATDDSLVTELCEEWVPIEYNATPSDIKKMRSAIRKKISLENIA